MAKQQQQLAAAPSMEPPADEPCQVCGNGDVEEGNEIIFCDKCDVAVHQACYGVTEIPDENWYCRACEAGVENPTCALCPHTRGAFKPTDDGRWAHVFCGIWNPETSWVDSSAMEPLAGIDRIPADRWKLVCSICGNRNGAPIPCSAKGCSSVFHPVCAQREKLRMEIKDYGDAKGESVVLLSFCKRHQNAIIPMRPNQQKKNKNAKYTGDLADIDGSENTNSGYANGASKPKVGRPRSKPLAGKPPGTPGHHQQLPAPTTPGGRPAGAHASGKAPHSQGQPSQPPSTAAGGGAGGGKGEDDDSDDEFMESVDVIDKDTFWSYIDSYFRPLVLHTDLPRFHQAKPSLLAAICGDKVDGKDKKAGAAAGSGLTLDPAFIIPPLGRSRVTAASLAAPESSEERPTPQLIATAAEASPLDDIWLRMGRKPIEGKHVWAHTAFHFAQVHQLQMRAQAQAQAQVHMAPAGAVPAGTFSFVQALAQQNIATVELPPGPANFVPPAAAAASSSSSAASSSSGGLKPSPIVIPSPLAAGSGPLSGTAAPLFSPIAGPASSPTFSSSSLAMSPMRGGHLPAVAHGSPARGGSSSAAMAVTPTRGQSAAGSWRAPVGGNLPSLATASATLATQLSSIMPPWLSEVTAMLAAACPPGTVQFPIVPPQPVTFHTIFTDKASGSSFFCQFTALPRPTAALAVAMPVGEPMKPPASPSKNKQEKQESKSGDAQYDISLTAFVPLDPSQDIAQNAKLLAAAGQRAKVRDGKMSVLQAQVAKETKERLERERKEREEARQRAAEEEARRIEAQERAAQQQQADLAAGVVRNGVKSELVDLEDSDDEGEVKSRSQPFENVKVEKKADVAMVPVKEEKKSAPPQAPGTVLPTGPMWAPGEEDDEVTAELLQLQHELARQTEATNQARRRLQSRITTRHTNPSITKRKVFEQIIEKHYRYIASWQLVRLALKNGVKDVVYPQQISDGKDKVPKKKEGEEGEAAPQDDYSVCCVCFGGESEETNPIIFCDSCNVPVHQRCYGLPNIPDGDWVCQRCSALAADAGTGSKKRVEEILSVIDIALPGIDAPASVPKRTNYSCSLCPISGGALKRTEDGRWAHITCALWIPKARLGDVTSMEPVMGVDQAVRKQQKENAPCSICKIDYGATVRCSSAECTHGFHPLCAWYAGNYMQVDSYGVDCRFFLFCRDHTPLERGGAFRNLDQQKDIRNRGRQEQARRNRSKRQRQAQERSRARARQRIMREDQYDPNTCAVCFQPHWPGPTPVQAQTPDLASQFAQYEPHRATLVKCDHCEVVVHPGCYGIPADQVPEPAADGLSGWKCARCTSASRDKDLQCMLCPRKGGAYKPTSDGRWCHVACAEWIPETYFGDEVAKEPVEGVNDVSRARRKLKCYLCKRQGTCINCTDNCHLTFHPICGLFAGTYMAMPTRRASCRKHTPVHLARDLDVPASYSRLLLLRRHFDKARMLIDLTHKREKVKLRILRNDLDIMAQWWRETEIFASKDPTAPLRGVAGPSQAMALMASAEAASAASVSDEMDTGKAPVPAKRGPGRPKGSRKPERMVRVLLTDAAEEVQPFEVQVPRAIVRKALTKPALLVPSNMDVASVPVEPMEMEEAPAAASSSSSSSAAAASMAAAAAAPVAAPSTRAAVAVAVPSTPTPAAASAAAPGTKGKGAQRPVRKTEAQVLLEELKASQPAMAASISPPADQAAAASSSSLAPPASTSKLGKRTRSPLLAEQAGAFAAPAAAEKPAPTPSKKQKLEPAAPEEKRSLRGRKADDDAMTDVASAPTEDSSKRKSKRQPDTPAPAAAAAASSSSSTAADTDARTKRREAKKSGLPFQSAVAAAAAPGTPAADDRLRKRTRTQIAEEAAAAADAQEEADEKEDEEEEDDDAEDEDDDKKGADYANRTALRLGVSSLPGANFKIGEEVMSPFKARWYPAKVMDVQLLDGGGAGGPDAPKRRPKMRKTPLVEGAKSKIKHSMARAGTEGHCYLVHYQGWNNRYDEWINEAMLHTPSADETAHAPPGEEEEDVEED